MTPDGNRIEVFEENIVTSHPIAFGQSSSDIDTLGLDLGAPGANTIDQRCMAASSRCKAIHAHAGWNDIAKGNHSDWTYLRAAEDANNHSKITELKLYRSDHRVETFPDQYTGHTADINNGGRGGTFLYLIWSTATVY